MSYYLLNYNKSKAGNVFLRYLFEFHVWVKYFFCCMFCFIALFLTVST